MDRFRLDGKVAIVTGATKGIGRAAATGLAEASADVAVLGNKTSPEETCRAVRALGRRALGFQGELSESSFRDQVVGDVLSQALALLARRLVDVRPLIERVALKEALQGFNMMKAADASLKVLLAPSAN